MAYFRVAYSDPLHFALLFNCQDQKDSKLHSSKASFCSHKESPSSSQDGSQTQRSHNIGPLSLTPILQGIQEGSSKKILLHQEGSHKKSKVGPWVHPPTQSSASVSESLTYHTHARISPKMTTMWLSPSHRSWWSALVITAQPVILNSCPHYLLYPGSRQLFLHIFGSVSSKQKATVSNCKGLSFAELTQP